MEKITRACGGVPLALEVMGGYLGQKFPECWIEATSALKNNTDITKCLQISYDGLGNDDEEHMFLDIACFMLGHSEHVAWEVWNSLDCDSRSWSLSRLVDKGLVKADAEGMLRMHDMGRKIVKEDMGFLMREVSPLQPSQLL